MKYIKAIAIIAVSFMLYKTAWPQQSYEIVTDKDSTEIGYCTFETNAGSIVSIGEISNKDIQNGYKGLGFILKYSDPADVQTSTFGKPDTSLVFQMGFQKENGNYIIIGRLSDSLSPEYSENIYLCEITSEMGVVWEKTFPAPAGYALYLSDFLIDGDNNIIIMSSMRIPPYTNGYLFLTKFDMNGELLNSSFLPEYDVRTYNDIILKLDGTGYTIIGMLNKSNIVRNWIDLDTSLNIVAEGGALENALQIAVTAKWLSDGNLFIVDGEGPETPGAYRDMMARVISPDLETTLCDTVFIDPDNVYIPVYDGMDFVYEDLIWTCTFNEDFPYFQGDETFKVYLFDSELNLKGMKVFGGDSRWWFFHLVATNDGGCIITGAKREPGGAELSDVDYYLIKVMPDDMITSAEETSFENDFDVAVFPNPFNNHLTTETMRENLVFSVFDSNGHKVLSGAVNNIPKTNFDSRNLIPGFYFYVITDKGRTIQCGKLIKQ